MSEYWYQTFDGVFFLTISSLVFGCFGLVIIYCLKSKCDNINICYGLITVHRNVELETEEEMRELEMGNKNTDENIL